MKLFIRSTYIVAAILLFASASHANAQDSQQNKLSVHITQGNGQSFVGKANNFSIGDEQLPDSSIHITTLWSFGDGTSMEGTAISHAYKTAGTYTVRVSQTSSDGQHSEDTTQIKIFSHVAILVADNSFPNDQIDIKQQQAAREQVLLIVVQPKTNGPETVTEEALTNQLLDARDAIQKADYILVETSGSVGSSVLSKLAQHIKQSSDLSFEDLGIKDKGIFILSDTPFGVLVPAAQAAFDQLRPSYILLTKPEAIDLVLEPMTADEAKQSIITSNIDHRLLGPFSARTVKDIGITNAISFGINYLVNKGVPINSITLILMLPVIATILSFSRQVIGLKAFGLVTPTMTTLSFLVMGLPYGLIVFAAVLLSGTLTRLVLRTLHLLYLPRMALVLTSASIAILLVFALGATRDASILASFSIFPILMLTLLAEEFIALQFKSGAKTAFTVTTWTLILSIGCYFIVSWQLLRTIIVSYPEIVLLTIPLNILFGRWSGLRITEYIRFRHLLRYI
ncbi:MAG TPA: PKD domain-containing protein [Candidatus Andersenbacteria bacterium]|nr:PKD domain-containing protein [Candidatus Andersenbacteria bacterium]